MNKRQPNLMSEAEFAEWEMRIQQAAREFNYPPTPDIARAVRGRMQPRTPRRPRLAWATVVLLVIFSAALTVPEVRATVLEVLRIGGITIFDSESTPTAIPTAATVSAAQVTRTPVPTPPILTSALQLPGETTLEAGREHAQFPTLPVELGEPDRIFVQELSGGAAITLVWVDDGDGGDAAMVLQILDNGVYGMKFHPSETVIFIEVNGERAAWLTEPHMLEFFEAGTLGREIRRQVSQNVLIWEIDSYTYRLESDLSMEEAVRVAESLG